jgi:two-component sensor histidine kinase
VKGWGQPHLDALVEDARIVVTELVTNAVVHAGGDDAVDLRIRAEQDGSLYLAVSDGAAVAPMMGELTDDAEGGRGLQIVQQLCTQWGVEADDSGGKRVWVELT